jgi:two-component system OmpR family sensor kinase
MRRYFYVALVALLPMLIGAGLALLLQYGPLTNFNYTFTGRYTVDLAALVSNGGLLIGLIILLVLAGREWAARRVQSAHTEAQTAESAARRRFLRRLDHELKNPLQIIRLGVVNLRQQAALTPEQTTSLDRVAQQTQRLQELVEDLRNLADIEERGLDRTAVRLQDVLSDAVDFAGGQGRTVALNLQQVPWPVSSVYGDPDLLLILFRNLIENALKFTDDGDRVEVRATDDGRSATVEVADTGSGIPPDDLPNIFEELYRGQNSRALNASGSGLGLALVKRIVDLHGGEIIPRSRVGQGTVMTVRLPLAPEQARRPTAED